jgi:peptide/nickel transport system substrate-binding protein
MQRYFRWQALVVLTSIILLVVLVAYLASRLTTVIVPDRGGTYIEGLVGAPQYINPILCHYNQVDSDLVALIFSGLTKLNEKNEIVPDLAQDYQVSEDGTVYTFHLRSNVFWHDGQPLTADDVVFTIQAIQDPDFKGAPYLADLWRDVAVEKVDERTVRFTLNEPFTPFIDYTTIGLLPQHLLKDVPAEELPTHPFNLQPVGAGPFAFKHLNDNAILLQSNLQSWRQPPFLEQVQFKFFPSYETLFHAYDQGEVEGIPGLRPTDLEWVQQRESLQLFTTILSGYSVIYLNPHNPNTVFFQDKNVRQALLYGLDRQRLINEVLNGQGLVAHSPILPNSWAFDPQIKKYAYDPKRAGELLDQAGWIDTDGDGIRDKDGQPLRFAFLGSDDALRRQILEEVTRQWAQIGVKAEPQTAGVSGLIRDFLRPRHFDAVLVEWDSLPADPDPYPLWHSTQANEDGQNYGAFVNQEADKLIEEARRITDTTRRTELYRAFQEIFAEEAPAILLAYPTYNYAVDQVIHDVQIGPLQTPSDRFRTIHEWYIATRRIIVSAAQQLGQTE